MPKYRKMLGDWEAPYFQAIVKLVETQSKTTLINWAVDYSEKFMLPVWNKYCASDPRPQSAIAAARKWLNKEIKLPEAKTSILDCHAAARENENNPAAYGAARAIGQSASAIHSATHCIGLPQYGALAVAYEELGADAKWEDLERRAAAECQKMLEHLQKISNPNEPNPAKINWIC